MIAPRIGEPERECGRRDKNRRCVAKAFGGMCQERSRDDQISTQVESCRVAGEGLWYRVLSNVQLSDYGIMVFPWLSRKASRTGGQTQLHRQVAQQILSLSLFYNGVCTRT